MTEYMFEKSLAEYLLVNLQEEFVPTAALRGYPKGMKCSVI